MKILSDKIETAFGSIFILDIIADGFKYEDVKVVPHPNPEQVGWHWEEDFSWVRKACKQADDLFAPKPQPINRNPELDFFGEQV